LAKKELKEGKVLTECLSSPDGKMAPSIGASACDARKEESANF
jgi:hypothetical protein